MTILPIRLAGDPQLHQKAAAVHDFNDPAVKQTIVDLIDTLQELGGVGLAAPQIGSPWRVMVMRILEERAGREGCAALPFTVYVNPWYEGIANEELVKPEGCFSLPGLMGKVSRYASIRYKAWSAQGEPIEGVLQGFHARVFQHEVDHLEGTLYWVRIQNCADFGFLGHIPDLRDPRQPIKTE